MRLPSLRAGWLAGACVLAGCGGAAHTTGSALLTRGELIARANHVCSAFNAHILALSPPIGLNQLEKLAEREQLLRVAEETQLAALSPRSALRNVYDAYLAAMSGENGLTAEALAAAKTHARLDVETLVPQGRRLAAEVAHDTRELGLAQCAIDAYGQTRSSIGVSASRN